jgi:hypothetical protein
MPKLLPVPAAQLSPRQVRPSGKPSCQLGRSLLVAGALGLKPADILASDPITHQTDAELPELTEEEAQEPNGQSSRLL